MNKCLVMLAAACSGAVLSASAVPSRPPAAAVSQRFVATFADHSPNSSAPWIVTDRVMARTETSLTIGERKVEIASTTAVSSSGAALGVDDIRVGDLVRAKIQKGPANTLHAVTVELLTD